MKTSNIFRPLVRQFAKFSSAKSAGNSKSRTSTTAATTDKMAGRYDLSNESAAVRAHVTCLEAGLSPLYVLGEKAAQRAAQPASSSQKAGTASTSRHAGQAPRARQAGTYSAAQRVAGQAATARQAGTFSAQQQTLDAARAALTARTDALNDLAAKAAERASAVKPLSFFEKVRAYFSK